MIRARIVVSGRVQGVFFRASTEARARELDLAGWVRNRDDGAVEVVAEGAVSNVEALIEWCGHGPPAARVTGVEVERSPGQGDLRGFRVRG